MKKIVFTLALGIFGASAFATDAYHFHNLGFSADGKYFAFSKSVIQDGSGFASAAGFVIDVANNQIVKSAKILIKNENSTEAEALKLVEKKMTLAIFAISKSNQGVPLWVRADTDWTPSVAPLFSEEYWVDGGASAAVPKFQIDLVETEAPLIGEDVCEGFGNKMFTATLTNVTSGTALVLQKDDHLPQSRGFCPMGYQVRQVIRYKSALVTIIRYSTYGFEGPDYQVMAVTATTAL